VVDVRDDRDVAEVGGSSHWFSFMVEIGSRDPRHRANAEIACAFSTTQGICWVGESAITGT